MRVWITLSVMNNGRLQLSCIRSTNERGGIGTGSALPPFNPNGAAEIEDILRNLGVGDELISEKMGLLRQSRPGELNRVEDRDVPDDALRDNGFVGL